jgi:SecD/SecF fusion protein
MKHFFWKFVICLLPCALAAWVTTWATIGYYNGDSGGFKLGVDLVGGTILVYEIDLRKSQDTENRFDPVRDINILAESLKRRIDPNDLYNITIRPAGGEGRIEIILPTGGTHRTKKADEVWRELVQKIETEFLPDRKDGKKLEVGRGKILELADRIQSIQSEKGWQAKLFSTPDGWKRLQESALDYWARLDNIPADKAKVMSWPTGDVAGLTGYIEKALAKTPDATTQKTIQNWLKKQAWEETMTRVRMKWPYLEPYKADMERITPDSTDQLTSFVLAKGSVIGQAALSLIQPLVGDKLERVFTTKDSPDSKQVHEFIKDLYGSPVQQILDKISTLMTDSGQSKDLSVEEVQRIKELVSKIGSLEFRILANDTDDHAAEDDVIKMINAVKQGDERGVGADPGLAGELKENAEKGLPPPGPRDPSTKEPKIYTIKTARGSTSRVTYSWVELGTTERKSLNLDNAARTDATRNIAWHKAAVERNRAVKLPQGIGTNEYLLQGALFYSRKCEDRNIPEDERRKKEFEYFVLTRDPEFRELPDDPTKRTPKIDGSYLVNATSAMTDLKPTVHFTFNTEGGNLFNNITRKNVSEDKAAGPEGSQKRRHLAIILDGMVMSAPTINSPIQTQGQISGNFTQKETDSLVNVLRAGRLPATLKPQPVSESSIAATLGEDTIQQGVKAILLSFAAVLAFMIVYYRFAGIVASVALMANLLLTVGFMVAVQATFTLSGLAGIVLTLGMAVDANVLIYERLREERERGASLLQAIRNGYDRALPTIIDTHLSSIFTAIVLYVVGNDNLKGFAVSMTVGLIISLFTSLYITRLMFDFWQSKGWLTKLTMMRLFAKPDIDFMSIRYVMFAVTLGLAIVGAGLFIGRLPNDLNIDFVGGTYYGGKLTKGVTFAELRKLVDEETQKNVLKDVKVKEEPGSDGRSYQLTFPFGDKETRTVTFSNIPETKNNTAAEREAIVAQRASMLPEPSVELHYNPTDDQKEKEEQAKSESRNFGIRTTEKEAELVQACLDQLLRDQSGKLLKIVFASTDKLEGRDLRMRFFSQKPATGGKQEPDATASPVFVKSLLNRELRREFGITDEKASLPNQLAFEVNGEGNSDSDGKYSVMKISFGADLKDEDRAKVEKAIKATERAFEARPLPDRLENFDSALANETRYRAMWAILASWAAILMYLWFRFGNWTFGAAAVICLIHDLFFTLGAIAVCYFVHGTFLGDFLKLDDFKIDLPSVAALLTLVGYSVNDTIVVFDRIREVRGKNPDLTPKMLNDSVNQTLSRTILSSLTVWLVVVVLYFFGGPGVHLFAFVMVVGVIVGTYSSIYIAAPLLLIFGEGKHEDSLAHPAAKLPAPQAATV